LPERSAPKTPTFQSTPSGGKATKRLRVKEPADVVSIHAFRGEGDPHTTRPWRRAWTFQSTPSGGKATNRYSPSSASCKPFQSTPSGGKATFARAQRAEHAHVSIHAFRGEGDVLPDLSAPKTPMFQSTPSGGKATGWATTVSRVFTCFNPRLPGGRRPRHQADCQVVSGFQSTPSGGKATGAGFFNFWHMWCFNPRLPGGRRPISPRRRLRRVGFQSTPSGGKATRACG